VTRNKFLRIQRGLTQGQVAARTRILRSVISQIETNRVNPTDHERAAIARVLGCDPDRLLDHIDESSLGPGAEFRDTEADND
jgi:transcriptional regulator with XRE-family HTH domain